LRLMKQTRGVSTLLLILLLLCSALFGALVSYLWVMSSYYNMPQDSNLLIVENVTFPVGNFSYFNVTVLNPSNSASDLNVTGFRLGVQGTSETSSINITTAEYPAQLPTILAIGTRQTFKCIENWASFAGQTVRVEPLASNASVVSYPYTTPMAKLTIVPVYDSAVSVEYFNLTATNSVNSVMNLTISDIRILGYSINVTPTLPYVLQPNQTEIFRCERDWNDLRGQKMTIFAETSEGYEASCETSTLLGAVLSIDEVRFNYTDTNHFDVIVRSAEDSTEAATLSMINLTIANESAISLNTSPPLQYIPITIFRQSFDIQCSWDWSAQRNETITVSVFTKQGFTPPNETVVTPPDTVWNMTEIKFDLNDTTHFLVSVANTPCSLHTISVTKILLNGTEAVLDPPFATLPNGSETTFNCTFDWSGLRGYNVSVTAMTADGSNISSIVSVPSIGLNILEDHFVFGTLKDSITNFTIPYFNVTVSNSINSLLDSVNITRIILQIGNQTYEIDNDITNPTIGQHGYLLNKGDTVTFMCLFNWVRYLTANPIKATVYIAEGFQASRTWQPQS
jgi:hypothetical protein